jgi:hypothetical protein
LLSGQEFQFLRHVLVSVRGWKTSFTYDYSGSSSRVSNC